MKLKPLGKNVIVKRELASEKKVGNLYIASDEKKKENMGVVYSVGREVTEDIKEGDQVLFSEYAGCPIPLLSSSYELLSMNEESIYCVVSDE